MPLDEVTESPILALIDQIFQMRARGEKVLGLHIGEPDFDTPRGIQDAAYRAMQGGFTHYVSSQGMLPLREAIARRASERHGLPVTAENVVVLPAKFAIYASLLATVGVGDEVVLPNPTYLFEQPLQLVGARPVYVPLAPDLTIDVAALEAAIGPRSRLLVLVTPSNPTGHVLSAGEVKAVLEVARRHRLTVVSDETYESLVYEGVHTSPARLGLDDPPVITVGSFSKIYAMTGWRVGYAIAPRPLVTRLVTVMEHTLTCVPPFLQEACRWALENAGPDEDRFRAAFRARRDHLLGRLAELPELSVVRPDGAFYVFPRYDLGLPSQEFCARLLAEEKLALVPGVAFGPAGEHHVRISYSSPESTLDDGVERLTRFLRRHAAEGR